MKIDCERIASMMLEEAKEGVALLKKHGHTPTLCIIRVGNDPASEVYVRNKVKTCTGLGIRCIVNHLPEDITQEELDKGLSILKETLEKIEKHYSKQYESAGYFAAIDKGVLFDFAVAGKDNSKVVI